MFDALFRLPAVVQRHRTAPLALERERFLLHLYRQGGTSRGNLVAYASTLLQVVRFLRLQRLRHVPLKEIQSAAERWAAYRGNHRKNKSGPWSAPYFTWIAKRWLRFHGHLVVPVRPQCPFDDKLQQFAEYMKSERGLSSVTICGRVWQTADFLGWLCRRHRRLRAVSLNDVDEYLARKASAWTNVTVASRAAALRAFFRYAESRDWCCSEIANGIKSPPTRSGLLAGTAPNWQEVQRLLQSVNGQTPAALRAKAVVLLFSLYALRRSEVAGLLLTDFDWQKRVLTVRRAKRGGLQQFPIQRELALAVGRYLRFARPKCPCQHVFVSLHPPYRPVHPVSLSTIVSDRMRRLGIRSGQIGPHSLRHSCATRLLQQGASLREIADFLGHRDCQSIGIYATFQQRDLRVIADLDLGRRL
jgi:integrase/recombinase XerD